MYANMYSLFHYEAVSIALTTDQWLNKAIMGVSKINTLFLNTTFTLNIPVITATSCYTP